MHSQRTPSGEIRNTDASRSNSTGEVSSVMCLRSSMPAPLPAITYNHPSCPRKIVCAAWSPPALMNQRLSGPVPFEYLDPVSADCIQGVVLDQQTLGPAPPQPGRDDLERVEHPVPVPVDQSPHRVAISHQQPAFAVERHRVTPPG